MFRALKRFSSASSTSANFFIFLTSLLTSVDCYAQGNIVYKCTNDVGVTVFSDRVCPAGFSEKDIRMPVVEGMAQRKAEHDAVITRDKSLADRIEASRLSTEQASRAAQDQQAQSNKALDDKVQQERSQKNTSVVSSPGATQASPVVTIPLVTIPLLTKP
jgi:hypothetical protein